MTHPTKRELKRLKRSDPEHERLLLTQQDDIVLAIFSYIDFLSLTGIQLVCLYWKGLYNGILGNKAFMTREELKTGIDQFCSDKVAYADTLARTYGWPIGKWNVSLVTNFESIFMDKIFFNEDIVEWDVSSATNTSNMFHGATSFNQDISQWDTSNVTSMAGMFKGARSFNQDISLWNTSQVVDMFQMFMNAASFNQDISIWNTSRVTNTLFMFLNATSFNQDISSWVVPNSNVPINMDFMFGLDLNKYGSPRTKLIN